MQYDFRSIESRWQAYWVEHDTFHAPNPGEEGFNPAPPKFYVLDMFPYPSGVGLHVGHPLGYIATDIIARYKRMQGFNVLHPMGYDAFGLPAEQFAVEHGVHPRITTERNIANMTRQLKRLGLSYDWDRCLATTDPGYYKWTQWIFLQLYGSWFDPAQKKAQPIGELVQALEAEEIYVGLDGEPVLAGATSGLDAIEGTPVGARKWFELTPLEQREFLDNQRLAYMAEVEVNWCPALGTVLANEEVTNDGRSERGNHPVFRRPLKQWMLRITAYADRLESELELVDWPEAIKLMQRNWIGRSEGARVDFALAPPLPAGQGGQTSSQATGVADAQGRNRDLAGRESPHPSPLPEGEGEDVITVFTTRPDTLFGATYMVLAPEHPLVEMITGGDQYHAVREYQKRAAAKSEVQRQTEALSGEKTGVFTGTYAINPVNNQRIPIWIADYVMMGYGTGAIMAVPAHDERDFAFAKQYGLPIRTVVSLAGQGRLSDPAAVPEEAFSGEGVNVHSRNDEVSLDGLPTAQAKRAITAWLESKGLGQAQVQYKLRDWLFSRQRYWGEPFPILHGPDGRIVPVAESDLPVELPEMEDFRPSASDDPNQPPQPPLARAPDSWKYVEIDGIRYTREFNTMPQWAGSCWYYLRFLDPHNAQRFVGDIAEQYWMLPRRKDPAQEIKPGVDLYVGGAEHAVLHLLYARFWHKVLFDLGFVSTAEPFGKLFNQGYIQAYYYEDVRGIRVPAEEIEERGGQFFHQGHEVTRHMGKMGKSLKNAVAPDEIADQYGCDTLRLYEMYLGPLDQSKIWRTQDIIGVHRFLQRLWRNFVDEESGRLQVAEAPASDAQLRLLHKTIKRVTDAMNHLSFNVAIAALIELNNELVGQGDVPRQIAEPMTLLLSPMAPHIAEELWRRLGHDQTLARHSWPRHDPAMLVEDQIEYPVQINGKLRGRVTLPAAADAQAVEQLALADEKVKALLEGKSVRKVIVVKGRLLNIVVG